MKFVEGSGLGSSEDGVVVGQGHRNNSRRYIPHRPT
jgi:hypothetical protein